MGLISVSATYLRQRICPKGSCSTFPLRTGSNNQLGKMCRSWHRLGNNTPFKKKEWKRRRRFGRYCQRNKDKDRWFNCRRHSRLNSCAGSPQGRRNGSSIDSLQARSGHSGTMCKKQRSPPSTSLPRSSKCRRSSPDKRIPQDMKCSSRHHKGKSTPKKVRHYHQRGMMNW